MTSDELYAFLDTRSISFDEQRARITGLPDVRDAVLRGLGAAGEAGEWGKFWIYLLVADAQPDRRYVPSIAAALELQSSAVPNEDALEVLTKIGDPGPLDLLKRIVFTEHDWDEFSQIAVKAVWAIAAIRTPEATAVLHEISERGNEYVRSWADSSLRVRNR
jgi:HEAT repeat protein